VPAPIVYGTDFSPNANAQAEVAAEFARRLDVPLVLAHSADLPRTLARDAKASRWIIAIRKRGLRKVATSLRERGLEIVEEVRPGSVAKTLAQVAQDRKAQLIIVSERRKRTGYWLRAGTAARVAVKTHTPMLLFRETDGLRGWLRGERPLKVFVAFNFSTTADAALRWVKQLTRVGPCEVILAYVNQPIDDYIRIGARGPLPFDENPPEVLAVLERDMKARARAVLGDVPVSCRVAAGVGRTQVHLANWAREENADLIVAGSRQSKGLKLWRHGSVSRALLKQAPVSVAIVPLAATGREPAAALAVKRHILVATDFSAVGNAAIPRAMALLPEGGLLTLMHVSRLAPVISNHVRPDLAREARLPVAERVAISKRLRQLVPVDAPQRGILVQTEVALATDVGEAISQAAERLSVDAICLATARRGGVSRAVLGSVTRTVLGVTRRPLTVVPVPRL
jgi:nucleotide-binding universal stress UspA family protein